MEVSIETSMSKQITKIKMLSHTNKGILLNNTQNCVMDQDILESFLFCMYLGSFTLPLPLHKAKWVQLNGKTLQVLKNSLVMDKLYLIEFRSEFRVEIVEKGHLAYLLTQRWLLVNWLHYRAKCYFYTSIIS